MAQGTEVTYRTTGDCSLELGTPKDGRLKLFFSEEEIADVEKAHKKIDTLDSILTYAKRRMSVNKGGTPR